MVKKAAPRTQPPEVPPTPLADFITKYRRSTGYIYRAGLLNFFDYINGKRIRGREAKPEDMVKYEALAAEYLADKKRKHTDDVVNYARYQTDKDVVPKTAHTRIVAVKEFLLRNGIEMDKITEKDIRRLQPKGGRRTDFEYIDKKTLSEILHHFDARGRAFVLVLASSGVRIGEALALNWSDLKCPDRKEYPDKPASVFIRISKTGNSRTTFISRECEEALREWKKVYDDYRTFATKRSLNLKSARKEKQNGDNRVFPFTQTSAYAIWDSGLQKAGYHNIDMQTRRVRMNIHRLRNFFSVQVASAAGQQVSELLLGHSDTYGGAYTGRSLEQLERDYTKCEESLTIGSTTLQMEKHEDEIKRLTAQNDVLRREINGLKQQWDQVKELERGRGIRIFPDDTWKVIDEKGIENK
jgi:integrase